MDAPLARHLTRFSAPPTAALAPAIVLAAEAPREPDITIAVSVYESRLREAADDARAAAEAEGAVERAQREVAQAAAIAEAVAATEARCASTAGDAVAAQIATVLAELRDDLAHQVAAVLRPLLDGAVVRRAAAAVAETVARAIADPDHPVLTVRGPASMIAAIEARLGAASGVTFAASEDDEVVVTGNGVRIETRLGTALAALADGETSA